MIQGPPPTKQEPEWRPIPDYGDVYTIEEFYHEVASGAGGDGTGYYARPPLMSDERINPFVWDHNFDELYTHIIWFNK